MFCSIQIIHKRRRGSKGGYPPLRHPAFPPPPSLRRFWANFRFFLFYKPNFGQKISFPPPPDADAYHPLTTRCSLMYDSNNTFSSISFPAEFKLPFSPATVTTSVKHGATHSPGGSSSCRFPPWAVDVGSFHTFSYTSQYDFARNGSLLVTSAYESNRY